MKKLYLTKKNRDDMWGEDGPYSEVNLSEQTRILDNAISRIFLVIEAKINPFTFEFILKHRKKFSDDEAIQQLLDHAEFRGIDGYVVSGGQEELIDKKSFELAFKYRAIVVENVLKMHDFVIRTFRLKSYENRSIRVSDKISATKHYIWDSATASVIPVEESIWDSNTYIDSPAGTKNGKIRYFVVLALTSGTSLIENEIKHFAAATKKVADKFKVDIKSTEGNTGYIMLTVLISPDTAPASFIEESISRSNIKKELFFEHYYVTNVSQPTWQEIESFLQSVRKRSRKKKG